MKIILSRKGFDSSAGRQANPILPNGTLLSMPIPEKEDHDTYSSLHWNGKTYYDIISSLKPRTSLKADSMCHLDPDIRKDVKHRRQEWKPSFGQMGAALKHLRNQGVSVGDLFLFFGWFRQSEEINGKLIYKKGAPDVHIIYGYMQIGSIIDKESDIPQWLSVHPHASYFDAWEKNQNAIFIPTKKLSFLPNMNGCDVLDYRKDRVLTKEGMSRRYWDLPSCFRNVNISYHSNPWVSDYFISAGRGQEFVLEATDEILEWATELIKSNK